MVRTSFEHPRAFREGERDALHVQVPLIQFNVHIRAPRGMRQSHLVRPMGCNFFIEIPWDGMG